MSSIANNLSPDNPITQKRTCKRCRAFETRQNEYRCELGYKIKVIGLDEYGFVGRQGIPLEPCPKPITLIALVDILKQRQHRIPSDITGYTVADLLAAADDEMAGSEGER